MTDKLHNQTETGGPTGVDITVTPPTTARHLLVAVGTFLLSGQTDTDYSLVVTGGDTGLVYEFPTGDGARAVHPGQPVTVAISPYDTHLNVHLQHIDGTAMNARVIISSAG
jgi:hypothetical protein